MILRVAADGSGLIMAMMIIKFGSRWLTHDQQQRDDFLRPEQPVAN